MKTFKLFLNEDGKKSFEDVAEKHGYVHQTSFKNHLGMARHRYSHPDFPLDVYIEHPSNMPGLARATFQERDTGRAPEGFVKPINFNKAGDLDEYIHRLHNEQGTERSVKLHLYRAEAFRRKIKSIGHQWESEKYPDHVKFAEIAKNFGYQPNSTNDIFEHPQTRDSISLAGDIPQATHYNLEDGEIKEFYKPEDLHNHLSKLHNAKRDLPLITRNWS